MPFLPPPKRSKPKEGKTLLFAILTAPFSDWDTDTTPGDAAAILHHEDKSHPPKDGRAGRHKELVLFNILELVPITGLCSQYLQTAYYRRKMNLFLI